MYNTSFDFSIKILPQPPSRWNSDYQDQNLYDVVQFFKPTTRKYELYFDTSFNCQFNFYFFRGGEANWGRIRNLMQYPESVIYKISVSICCLNLQANLISSKLGPNLNFCALIENGSKIWCDTGSQQPSKSLFWICCLVTFHRRFGGTFESPFCKEKCFYPKRN